MLYPGRGAPGDPDRSGRELAVGAAILFFVAAAFAVLGGVQGAFGAFACAMALHVLRTR